MHVDRLAAARLAAVHGDQILACLEQFGRSGVEGVDLKLRDEAREAGGLLAIDEHVGIFIVMDEEGGLVRHGVERDGAT